MTQVPGPGAQRAGVRKVPAKPPFPTLLASLVSHLLMLSLDSMEGAATVDPINKYTFSTSLKSVISLCL